MVADYPQSSVFYALPDERPTMQVNVVLEGDVMEVVGFALCVPRTGLTFDLDVHPRRTRPSLVLCAVVFPLPAALAKPVRRMHPTTELDVVDERGPRQQLSGLNNLALVRYAPHVVQVVSVLRVRERESDRHERQERN